MIHIETGSMFDRGAEALVNPVNCVGVSGAGLALEFKERFPENFVAYRIKAAEGDIRIGEVDVIRRCGFGGPLYVVNFPTKRHWRDKSRLEDIESGLSALVSEVIDRHIRSIAIPALGCGLGGLDWAEVRPMIENAFAAIPDVDVSLFAPR